MYTQTANTDVFIMYAVFNCISDTVNGDISKAKLYNDAYNCT